VYRFVTLIQCLLLYGFSLCVDLKPVFRGRVICPPMSRVQYAKEFCAKFNKKFNPKKNKSSGAQEYQSQGQMLNVRMQ
jgi:hypothetical protein